MLVTNRRLLIILVLVVMAAVVIRWQRLHPLPNSFTSTNSSSIPELSQVFNKAQQAETYHTEITLQLHLPNTVGQQTRPFPEVVAKMNGDVKNIGNTAEFVGQLHGEVKGQGSVLFTDGELRALTNGVYFNLQTLPSLVDPVGSLTNKWTFVDTKLLQTKNPQDISQAVQTVLSKFKEAGVETINGSSLYKYTATLGADDEQKVQEALQADKSGNQAYDTLARLLQNYDLTSTTMWVDNQSLPRQLSLVFHEPGHADTTRAELTVNWQDFGKAVTFEEPKPVATVAPSAFKQFFGEQPTSSAIPTPQVKRP